MESIVFGNMPDGREVRIYTITNSHGMSVSAMSYGGVITSISVPDKQGNFGNVVRSFNTLDEYIHDTSYTGAIVGRCTNRIAGANFIIDGKQYNLYKNDGENALHGGRKGFNTKLWHIQEKRVREGNALRLTAASLDGEEGYPGKLNVEVLYILTEKNELIIRFSAVSNKKTVVNLVNHTYFNLSAGTRDTIENHLLQVKTNYFLRLDEQKIPTGEFVAVEGTPLDFRQPKYVKEALGSEYDQIALTNGVDHCFAVPTSKEFVVRCVDEQSGRTVEVTTGEPGIQIYSGNFLSPKPYAAIAFEAQHFPDSVHHKNFPTVILNPGREYVSECRFLFGVQE